MAEIKRYSPLDEEADHDKKRNHVIDCIKYIYEKLTNIYGNEKMIAKFDFLKDNKSYELYEKEEIMHDDKIVGYNITKNQEQPEIAKFFCKKTKKSLIKLFDLITDYSETFPFIEAKDLERILDIKYGPSPIKNALSLEKFNFDCSAENIGEDSFWFTDDGIKLLFNMIWQILYECSTSFTYKFKIPKMEKKSDMQFLDSLMYCLTFKSKYLYMFEVIVKVEDEASKKTFNTKKEAIKFFKDEEKDDSKITKRKVSDDEESEPINLTIKKKKKNMK